jgi:hypothetical protein
MLEQRIEVLEGKVFVSNLRMVPDPKQENGVAQKKDNDFQEFKRKMLGKKGTEFREGENGTLYFREWICVPKNEEPWKRILEEAHKSKYSIHPREVKMCKDLKKMYRWPGMKKNVTQNVSICLACHKVKAEHKRIVGLLQPLPVPEWKWEEVTMDFVIGLPLSQIKKDAIWVGVDRLTKAAHFILINVRDPMEKLTKFVFKK